MNQKERERDMIDNCLNKEEEYKKNVTWCEKKEKIDKEIKREK